MKVFVLLLCACVAFATPMQKRLGVPLYAEEACYNTPEEVDPEVNYFVADRDDCQSFYHCDHRWPKHRICAGTSVWSMATERCESQYDAVNDDCGYVAPPRPEEPLDGVDVLGRLLFEGSQWECADGNGAIAYKNVCDGGEDCADGSDEDNCAAACNEQNCRLPDCRCAGPDIPGGLNAADTPQLVAITWDEAIRVEDYNHLYQQVFKRIGANRAREPRRNPNGCPAVGTFFASHQFTDYAAAQSIYGEGNEIAAHSISKRLPASYWETASMAEYAAEYADQRIIFDQLGNIPARSIQGLRATGLQTAGDTYINFAQNNGFSWDSSYATDRNNPPLWPFTLDYRMGGRCAIEPCPVAPHRGFWEVPLVDWVDTNDTLCENVDSCYFPNDKAEALELFRSNFRRHYESNKALFLINLRSRFFLNDGYHNLEALQDFLDELENLGDVYFVTVSQAVEWMQDPVNTRQSAEFFECDYDDRQPLCAHPNLCGYFNITYAPNSEDHPGDRFFQTCNECPPVYPWVGNPEGN